MDGRFSHAATLGAGTDIYIVDTGLRTTHVDFEDRYVKTRTGTLIHSH